MPPMAFVHATVGEVMAPGGPSACAVRWKSCAAVDQVPPCAPFAPPSIPPSAERFDDRPPPSAHAAPPSDWLSRTTTEAPWQPSETTEIRARTRWTARIACIGAPGPPGRLATGKVVALARPMSRSDWLGALHPG